MSTFIITIDGKNYDVKVNETDLNVASVEVDGRVYQVEFESAAATNPAPAQRVQRPNAMSTAPAAPTPKPSGSTTAIKSPLPGTIIAVNVKVGDVVKKGDVLLVMEAMKMENNIMANKDGVVKSVYVTNGQTVMQEDALVDID